MVLEQKYVKMNLQILTLKNLEELYSRGWEVEVSKENLKDITGKISSEDKIIKIYKNNIRNNEELNLTILHEFLHAQDFEFNNLNESGISDDISYESFTEQRAIFVYRNFPEILEEIKNYYPNLK